MGSNGDHDRDHQNQKEKKKLLKQKERGKANLEKKFLELKTLCGIEGCFIYFPSSSETINGGEIIQSSTIPENPSEVVEILKRYIAMGDPSMETGKRKLDLSYFDGKPTKKKIKGVKIDQGYCKQSPENEKPTKKKMEGVKIDQGYCKQSPENEKPTKKKMEGVKIDQGYCKQSPEICRKFQNSTERVLQELSKESLMEIEKKLESGLEAILEKKRSLLLTKNFLPTKYSNGTDDDDHKDMKKKGKMIDDDDHKDMKKKGKMIDDPTLNLSLSLGFDNKMDYVQPWRLLPNLNGASTSSHHEDPPMLSLGFDQTGDDDDNDDDD